MYFVPMYVAPTYKTANKSLVSMLVRVCSEIHHGTIPTYDGNDILALSVRIGRQTFKIPFKDGVEAPGALDGIEFILCEKNLMDDQDAECPMDLAEEEFGVHLSTFQVTYMFENIRDAMNHLKSKAHNLQRKWTMYTLGDLWASVWNSPHYKRPMDVDEHGNEWVPRHRVTRKRAGNEGKKKRKKRRVEESEDENDEQAQDDALYNAM